MRLLKYANNAPNAPNKNVFNDTLEFQHIDIIYMYVFVFIHSPARMNPIHYMILSVHSVNSLATFAHSSLWRPYALHAPISHSAVLVQSITHSSIIIR
jgi:hypothetical protein